MNQYEQAVLEAARKWYEAWGKSGADELWDAVGQMVEREHVVSQQPRVQRTADKPRKYHLTHHDDEIAKSGAV